MAQIGGALTRWNQGDDVPLTPLRQEAALETGSLRRERSHHRLHDAIRTREHLIVDSLQDELIGLRRPGVTESVAALDKEGLSVDVPLLGKVERLDRRRQLEPGCHTRGQAERVLLVAPGAAEGFLMRFR